MATAANRETLELKQMDEKLSFYLEDVWTQVRAFQTHGQKKTVEKEAKTTRDRAVRKVGQLMHKNAGLEKELEEARSQISQLEERLRSAPNDDGDEEFHAALSEALKVSELQETIEKLKKEKSALETQLEHVSRQLRSLMEFEEDKDGDPRNGELKEVKAENVELKAQIEALRAEMAASEEGTPKESTGESVSKKSLYKRRLRALEDSCGRLCVMCWRLASDLQEAKKASKRPLRKKKKKKAPLKFGSATLELKD